MFPDHAVSFLGPFSPGYFFCFCQEVVGLGGAQHFHRNYMFHIVQYLAALPDSNGAHADVVFLVGGRGNGVYAGRMGQDLVFGNESRSCVLGDHEAGVEPAVVDQKGRQFAQLRVDHPFDAAFGHIAQFGNAHGEVVGGHGNGLAMEIAPQADFPCVRENQRVGGGGIDFNIHDIAGMHHSILTGAVYLGRTTQGVGILDACAALMGKNDLAVAGQAQHVVCRSHLAGMRADLMDAGIEFRIAAHEHFQAHGTSDVGQLGQPNGIVYHQAGDAGHYLGAVYEGEAFACQQFERFEADFGQGPGAAHTFLFKKGFPFSEQDQSQVGHGCQVSAGAHGALFRNHGSQSFV